MTETRKIKIFPANNKGFTLATSIILIIFASTAVLSVTTFIIERLSQTEMKRVRTQALYLAQAGIHNAVYFYKSMDIAANGYFSLGQTSVDANNYFVLGATPAELLMVNTATAALTSSWTRLSNVTIQNATDSSTIVIDRMVVNWPANGRKLKEIWINGSRLFRSGGGVSPPADANLKPGFPLSTPLSTYPIDYLLFSGSMAGVAYIDVQFLMTDGSAKTVRLYQDGVVLNKFNFTVKASGKTAGSAIYRTVRAEYNALTNKISNYDEIPDQIP